MAAKHKKKSPNAFLWIILIAVILVGGLVYRGKLNFNPVSEKPSSSNQDNVASQKISYNPDAVESGNKITYQQFSLIVPPGWNKDIQKFDLNPYGSRGTMITLKKDNNSLIIKDNFAPSKKCNFDLNNFVDIKTTFGKYRRYKNSGQDLLLCFRMNENDKFFQPNSITGDIFYKTDPALPIEEKENILLEMDSIIKNITYIPPIPN